MRSRRSIVFLGMASVAAALAGPVVAVEAGTADTVIPLSIAVSGNHFVNGVGQTIRLLGVDRPGTEYACEEGFADSSGAIGSADAAAIAGWHANAVRIPLNEDCWLGINGQPSYGTIAGYQAAVKQYVADLNADGIYAILDLHWSAPGSVVADGQRPMPDDHSAAFWTSVATTFKANPAVVFDAFNEPYSPAADGYTNYPVSWSCWKNGGCTVPDAADGTTPNFSQTYQAVGMQTLVDAIRATGATQPIMLGGLSYANDLSGWLANEPTDPDQQLAASAHIYDGEACDTVSCWNAQVAPVAASVPVVTGEFGQDAGADCSDTGDEPGNFDNTFMDWADAHGVGYLGWGWYLYTGSDCLYLIKTSADTPAAPNGVALHDHLAALAAAAPPTGTETTTTSTTTTTTSTMTGAKTTKTPTGTSVPGSSVIARLVRALKGFTAIPGRAVLLRRRGLPLRFTAAEAGRLAVQITDGRRTVASLRTRFPHTGTRALLVALTPAGRRLLKGRHVLNLTIHASFAGNRGPSASVHGTARLV